MADDVFYMKQALIEAQKAADRGESLWEQLLFVATVSLRVRIT